MKITPLDIVSMIAIASIVISAYAAARVSKGQNTKPEKTEPSSPAASTSKLRAELDDLKKRVAELEKK